MPVQTVSFFVFTNGDMSVGIPGDEAEIKMNLDPDNKEDVEFVRDILIDAFTKMWDFKVTCYTKQELDFLNALPDY